MSKLIGLFTAMVSPFDEQGALNFDALDSYLQFQESAGMDGVLVCGTNGEAASMSVSERISLLEAVIARAGKLRLMVGTGAASITDAVELTKHASSKGVEAVLVLPPFFYKNPSAAGLAAYFETVAAVSDVPVLLYSIPQQTSVPISDELLELLRGCDKVCGLKDSQGDWTRTSHLITSYPQYSIFAGSDELMSRNLIAGGAGSISGTANSFPELVANVRNAVMSGGDVQSAQAKLDLAKKIVMQFPLMAGNKTVLANRGVARMWVRPPLTGLSKEQEVALLNELSAKGLL